MLSDFNPEIHMLYMDKTGNIKKEDKTDKMFAWLGRSVKGIFWGYNYNLKEICDTLQKTNVPQNKDILTKLSDKIEKYNQNKRHKEKIDLSFKKAVQTPIEEQKRTTPSLSFLRDTVKLSRGNFQSVHKTGELFRDDEIIEKLPILKKDIIGGRQVGGNPIYVKYTQYEKAIIQQQAMRGCTAATAAMLIMDNGQEPNIEELQSRNIGDDDHIVADITDANLTPLVSHATSLQELQEIIEKNGSAIVTLTEKIGGHVIVVDDVDLKTSKIRIRDPYHGWEITIADKAFLKEWKGGSVIQALKR